MEAQFLTSKYPEHPFKDILLGKSNCFAAVMYVFFSNLTNDTKGNTES